MPVHDWTRVEAGVFHDFHHAWIEEIKRALNRGILPADYYALAEQHAAGFGPDVLTLQGRDGDDDSSTSSPENSGGVVLAAPTLKVTAETDLEFYRRKQNTVAVRHVSGDRIVAMVEIVSPGNKSSRNALRAFVQKASELLEKGVHLLIVDLHPPGRRDPNGIHSVIWDAFAGQEYVFPGDKRLTLAAYECDLSVKTYVIPFAVGDKLRDMPLFLKPGGQVPVPLEATYQSAWDAVPQRWRAFLEARR
ncbi:MAG: DUF4058 family protein [Planctomycetes bacterium]|nr:DUF4058 family protein [Planctomycetota bacterium]